MLNKGMINRIISLEICCFSSAMCVSENAEFISLAPTTIYACMSTIATNSEHLHQLLLVSSAL